MSARPLETDLALSRHVAPFYNCEKKERKEREKEENKEIEVRHARSPKGRLDLESKPCTCCTCSLLPKKEANRIDVAIK